jgi:uncharacterized RDD family membrane protein YckC
MLCSTCMRDYPETMRSCPHCDSDWFSGSAGAQPASNVDSQTWGWNENELLTSTGTRTQPSSATATMARSVPASRGYRFLGLLLDSVLITVTFGIGWLVWFFVIAGRGQTPAKQIMKMQVTVRTTGQPSFAATFWRYFVPNILSWFSLPFTVLGLFSLPFALAWLLGLVQFIGIVLPLVDALMIFGKSQRRLVDRLFGTQVWRF